jgi:hypothetical protein
MEVPMNQSPLEAISDQHVRIRFPRKAWDNKLGRKDKTTTGLSGRGLGTNSGAGTGLDWTNHSYAERAPPRP